VVRGLDGGDLETTICPVRLVSESSWGFLKLYAHYKAGHLPNAGGMRNQPHAFFEGMALISAELNGGGE
jgi:hypothetical protein